MRWLYALFGADFQSPFERELDLARSFLARFSVRTGGQAVRHDARPLPPPRDSLKR
jgi:hypothetical protein